MVIAARSKSIHGPWENCPANPLFRTRSAVEKWWSRGHATLVEGPAGDWWSVYHGYENGYWTLGRQALLAPVEWTDDGWRRLKGGAPSPPIAQPAGGTVAGPAGLALAHTVATLPPATTSTSFHPAANDRRHDAAPAHHNAR